MSTPLDAPRTGGTNGASSVGGGPTNGNKSINSDARKKTLWSYILPLNANEHGNNNTPTKETPLPTTSPSDRNAVSIRLALGDTQASLQRLADRVDRVLDQQRQEANKVEALIGGVVQSVERAITVVAESTVAHTSKLEEALVRITRLEESLSAQSKAITDLQSQAHQTHMALLPVQALPAEIQNSQLKTEHALDRSAQQHALSSAETKTWMAEYQSATSASLDRVRQDVNRGLDAWSGALAGHRQEMSGLFSAVMAGIRTLPAFSEYGARARRSVDNTLSGQVRESTPQIAPVLNTTHTTTDEQPHGQPSSSGFVTAQSGTQVEHAVKNPTSSSRHLQASPVHDKNSTESGRVLVEDTQSTALSSVPEEQEDGMTFGGRGFGALSKRASSGFASFTNPGSPGFTIQRRPFVQAQNLPPAPGMREPGSSELQAGTSDSPRSTTLGRSSPNGNPGTRLTLKKRAARVEDAPPGPTKRSRKAKTRMLMDSQELLTVDSSPER